MLLLAGLALLAVVPLTWTVARAAARREARRLRGPVLLAVAGTAVVVTGSHHFANAWPGTGAHPWTQPGAVPAGVAAFGWAATLSVSAYWAHPAALAAFPAAEIAWMALSPVALIAGVAGVAGVVRRLDLSARSCVTRRGWPLPPPPPWLSSWPAPAGGYSPKGRGLAFFTRVPSTPRAWPL